MFKNIFIFSLLFTCIEFVSSETLTDVDVTSPMFTNSINESKYPAHIIPNKEINSNQSLGDNLKGLSGVSNADYGAAIGQPSIRGLTGNRTKILSNNIAVNDLSSLSADHINAVDLNNISHIEVIRGPSSIFTQGGTSGGIVNVISDIISDKKYSDDILKFDYMSVNNGYGHNFLFKRNLFNINLFFSINNKHFDNYGLAKGSLFEETLDKGTKSNSDHKDQNINFGISLPKEWFSDANKNNEGEYGDYDYSLT